MLTKDDYKLILSVLDSEIDALEDVKYDLPFSDREDVEVYQKQLITLRDKAEHLAIDDVWDRPGREL